MYDFQKLEKINSFELTIENPFKHYRQIKGAFDEVFKICGIVFEEDNRGTIELNILSYIEDLRSIYKKYDLYTTLHTTPYSVEVVVNPYMPEDKYIQRFHLLINASEEKMIIQIDNISSCKNGYFKEPGVLLHRIYGQQLEKYITNYTQTE